MLQCVAPLTTLYAVEWEQEIEQQEDLGQAEAQDLQVIQVHPVTLALPVMQELQVQRQLDYLELSLGVLAVTAVPQVQVVAVVLEALEEMLEVVVQGVRVAVFLRKAAIQEALNSIEIPDNT